MVVIEKRRQWTRISIATISMMLLICFHTRGVSCGGSPESVQPPLELRRCTIGGSTVGEPVLGFIARWGKPSRYNDLSRYDGVERSYLQYLGLGVDLASKGGIIQTFNVILGDEGVTGMSRNLSSELKGGMSPEDIEEVLGKPSARLGQAGCVYKLEQCCLLVSFRKDKAVSVFGLSLLATAEDGPDPAVLEACSNVPKHLLGEQPSLP